MNPDIPQHLHATRDLLMASLSTHPSEEAPALPKGLLEDLTQSVAIQPTAPARSRMAGMMESLRDMLGSSSFGTAAAALAVVAITTSVVLRPDGDWRGGPPPVPIEVTAQVILVGAPSGLLDELKNTTDLELSNAASADSISSLTGARVIVNFEANSIVGINTKGELVYESSLPESISGLSLEIASALTRL